MHAPSSLISVLILPCLGLSLLLCSSLRPPAVLSTDEGEGRQRKPASDNKTSLILLRSQYANCARCRRSLRLARTMHEEVRWRGNTREAARLYNRVADDADPSVFALTSLPRHLCRERSD